jgi:hypothetical protein
MSKNELEDSTDLPNIEITGKVEAVLALMQNKTAADDVPTAVDFWLLKHHVVIRSAPLKARTHSSRRRKGVSGLGWGQFVGIVGRDYQIATASACAYHRVTLRWRCFCRRAGQSVGVPSGSHGHSYEDAVYL